MEYGVLVGTVWVCIGGAAALIYWSLVEGMYCMVALSEGGLDFEMLRYM